MRSSIWIGIFIGSTIGGLIPELWGGDMLSYSGVLLSGVGAFVGLWLGSRASRCTETKVGPACRAGGEGEGEIGHGEKRDAKLAAPQERRGGCSNSAPLPR